MAPQTSCPTLRVGQWQMTRCLPAVWCLMLSACVGQHNVMSSVSASFLTPGSLASMVGDVWSDGLTVYYCCHLVTKQSKVCGHRRPDPCCGVTTCDCSQARLSPLAPQLVTDERRAADTGERASWPVSGAVHSMFTRGSKNAFHSAQARLAESDRRSGHCHH